MAITGLESKASTALSGLRGSDRAIQEVGIVVKELASAIEQLSRHLDDLKVHQQGLEDEAERRLKGEDIDDDRPR